MALPRRVAVVIPLRLASSRVPRKALADVAGLPLFERVRRAALASEVGPVVIATDSDAIRECAEGFGAEVIATGPAPNGTRRVAAAAEALGVDRVINVQGDQPLLDPDHVRTLGQLLERSELATVSAEWPTGHDPNDPALVKIASTDGLATNFSRAPIPGVEPRLHLGLYGYSLAMLRRVTSLPIGARARAEGLEQLTWLEAGLPIHVARVGPSVPAVDTVEQLERVRDIFQPHTRRA